MYHMQCIDINYTFNLSEKVKKKKKNSSNNRLPIKEIGK